MFRFGSFSCFFPMFENSYDRLLASAWWIEQWRLIDLQEHPETVGWTQMQLRIRKQAEIETADIVAFQSERVHSHTHTT